jgi:CHASE2 domain-containing sensor protein
VTDTSRRPLDARTSDGRPAATALRATSALSVLAILWQGGTAGGILMSSRESFELHEAGAIVVHVLTGLAAIAAFLLWRAQRGPVWPTVLAAVVFAASFVQAALGDEETMWAHVPGALVLMLGAAVLLARAVLPRRSG